jgi:hypothetical protein
VAITDFQNQADGIRIIETAIDGGINFLDNPTIPCRGRRSARQGHQGKRDKVFLMTKPHPRQEGALKSRDESPPLQTDYPTPQFHEIV